VPVAPAQHYASGGIATDVWGRTSVPGLLACGEVSATGVHGANRLASNSLLEGLVWGHRLVERLELDGLPSPGDPQSRPGAPGLVPPAARTSIQAAMTAGAGVVRDADGLAATAATLAAQPDDAAEPGSSDAWETTNLHAVASVLTAAASARTETRGGHWRADHPQRDDERWRGRLRLHLEDGVLVDRFERMPHA
jgi:L-aspartate oxidase